MVSAGLPGSGKSVLAHGVAGAIGAPYLCIDGIECIEEGGTEPTVPLLRRLAAALNATVHLTSGHDLGSVSFQTLAA